MAKSKRIHINVKKKKTRKNKQTRKKYKNKSIKQKGGNPIVIPAVIGGLALALLTTAVNSGKIKRFLTSSEESRPSIPTSIPISSHGASVTLDEQPGSRGPLYIFNDDEVMRYKSDEGENSAKIRIYNQYGQYGHHPKAAGIPIGTSSEGRFKEYSDKNFYERREKSGTSPQDAIDDALGSIHTLLETGLYSSVVFPSSRNQKKLGTRSDSQLGDKVNKYIVTGIKRTAEYHNVTARGLTHVKGNAETDFEQLISKYYVSRSILPNSGVDSMPSSGSISTSMIVPRPKTIYIYTDTEANYHTTGTGLHTDIRSYNGPSVSGSGERIGDNDISAGIPIADDKGGYQSIDVKAMENIDTAFEYIRNVLLESYNFREIAYHVDNGKLATFAIRFDDIGSSPPPKKPRVIKYNVNEFVKEYIMMKIDYLVKDYGILRRELVSNPLDFEAVKSINVSIALHRTK